MNDTPRFVHVLKYLFMITLIICMGYPVFWNITAALKTNSELVDNPYGLPKNPQIENIRTLWVEGDFLRYLRNSLIISFSSITGIVLMTTMAGFAFSRRRTPIFNILFGVFLAGMMVPGEVTLVPIFRIISNLGLRNSLPGLIIIYLTWTPFGIFVMRTYFLNVPFELGEAARIDGCSEFGVYWRVYMPLATPAMATVAIFGYIWTWNDFLWPLILVQKPEWYNIQIGVLLFQDKWTIDWAMRNSGLVFAILPPLIIYLIFSRGIQKGLTAGALKM